MKYQASFKGKFRRRLKKMGSKNTPLRALLKASIDTVWQNPFAGQALVGPLQGFFSYHFADKSHTQYRILYAFYECDGPNVDHCNLHPPCEAALERIQSCKGMIDFIVVGTREEFNSLYKRDYDGERREIEG